jgi:C4-dicarboxylate-specific signal transduction histidine kinase
MGLVHANRIVTLGHLTASIAHEVSQPVAAMLTNAGTAARWLTREPPGLEKARELIANIIDDGNRAAGIISGIRDLVKKAPSRDGELAVNDMILEVIALINVDLLKNRVVLHSELASGLPLIQGDRIQLQQVILNLARNAVEAMGEVGEESRRLLISTGVAGSDSVLIRVSDTGPGLPADGLVRAFEAFYTTKAEGLGMGLSICRSIVEAHGGRIWATPNESRGAIFSVTLPVRQSLLEDLRP